MLKLKDFFKGMIVGIGMIAPGLSGGVFAVILKIYDRIINGIKTLPQHPIQVIKDLFFIGLGGVVGVGIAFIFLLKVIEFFPFPLTMVFIGFILGAIPGMSQRLKGQPWNGSTWITFIIPFVFILGLPFLPRMAQVSDTSWWTYGIMFLLGIIAAATVIIPGVSGSMVFMALGYYFYLYELVHEVLNALLAGALGQAISVALPLIPFALGVLVGVIGLAHLLTHLLNHFPQKVYTAVIAILIASPVSILSEVFKEYPNAIPSSWLATVVIGLLMASIGLGLSWLMERVEEKYQPH